MNAVRKETIEYSPEFFTTPVMKVLAVQDHSIVIFKPTILASQTLGARAGGVWPSRWMWTLNELLVDVPTCTMVMADAQGGVTVVPSMYCVLQVLMSGVMLRQEGVACPSVATGNGIRAKSASLTGVCVIWSVVTAGALFFVL